VEQAIETNYQRNGGGGSTATATTITMTTRRGNRRSTTKSPIASTTAITSSKEGERGDGAIASNEDNPNNNVNTKTNTRSKRKRKAKTPIIIESSTLRTRTRGRKRGASAALDVNSSTLEANHSNSAASQSANNVDPSTTTTSLHSTNRAAAPQASNAMSEAAVDSTTIISNDAGRRDCSNLNLVSSESVRQLLTIDAPSYRVSLQQSAKQLFSDIVFPLSFPWYKPKVLLAASTPRDIDELHPFLRCHDDMEHLEPRYHDEIEGKEEEEKENKNTANDRTEVDDVSSVAAITEHQSKEEVEEREANDLKLERWLYDALVYPEVYGVNGSGARKFSTQSFAYKGKCGIDGGMGYVQTHSKNSLEGERLLFGGKMRCFVRRTNDPGVIQLTSAMLPFAPTKKENNNASSSMIKEEECDWRLATSCLPWSWSSKRRPLYSNEILNYESNDEKDDDNIDQDARMLQRLANNRRARVKDAYENTRQWKISVKVAGVSSRSTIFPGFSSKRARATGVSSTDSSSTAATATAPHDLPSTTTNIIQPLTTTTASTTSSTSTTTVVRPNSRYLCFQGPASDGVVTFQRNSQHEHLKTKQPGTILQASLPASVQNGRSITMDLAISNELDGTAEILGTYDCRPTNLAEAYDDLLEQSNEVQQKHFSKRINVGRTRIIWSTVPRDAFGRPVPYQSGPGVRIPYQSMISNSKLEATAYKRPREVTVGVVMNGVYYRDGGEMDDEAFALELAATSSLSRSNKRRRTRRSTFLEEIRSTQRRSSALTSLLSLEDIEFECRDPYRNHFGNATVTLQRDQFRDAMKRRVAKERKTKKVTPKSQKSTKSSSSSSDPSQPSSSLIPLHFNATNVLQYVAPEMDCFPLDDGSMRTCCVFPGRMKQGVNVHEFLKLLSAQTPSNDNETPIGVPSSSPRCTICWETSNTVECVSCGIVAHLECCHDTDTSAPSSNSWKCPVCSHLAQHGSSVAKSLIEARTSTAHDIGIAAHKPRRSQKRPSKFDDDAFQYESKFLNNSNGNKESKSSSAKNNTKTVHEFFPKCQLCPHVGGIMSMSQSRPNDEKPTQSQWVHDVCRTWCCPPTNQNGNDKQDHFVSVVNNICAICGGGSAEKATGLIKCAARGCQVSFHPFCAMLTSQLVAVDDNENDHDDNLVAQFTLDVLQATSGDDIVMVPVGYCGLHNPRRDKSYFGLPPNGNGIVCESMRVPSATDEQFVAGGFAVAS